MIFRLARRTSFAPPVGLGAALFALATALAFVGSPASPAGVARAQEGTDDGVTGQAGRQARR